MTKILITGGSGLIGNAISRLLVEKNYQPVLLSRIGDDSSSIKKYKWDITKGYIDSKAFEGVEHIIHLAGAGVGSSSIFSSSFEGTEIVSCGGGTGVAGRSSLIFPILILSNLE